jgi:hypothetical protein
MATEKQIAANRANAQKSTGPKTVAGKLKSSRNAFRYGLSCPLQLDPVVSAKAAAIVEALAGKEPDPETALFAAEFARAQLDLDRIRSTRAELTAKIDFDQPSLRQLQHLVGLDRYERYATTKRRRAAVKFQAPPANWKTDRGEEFEKFVFC